MLKTIMEKQGGVEKQKFYKEMDAILGHRPASAPTVLLDTGASISDDTIPDSQQSAGGEEAQGKCA